VNRHRVNKLNGRFKKRLWMFAPYFDAKNLCHLMPSFINKYDLIYSFHFLYAYASKVSSPQKKAIFQIPIIAPRENEINFYNGSFKSKIFKKIMTTEYYNIESRAVRCVDKLAVLSKMMKRYLVDYYKIRDNRVNVVYPGVDLERFKKREINSFPAYVAY